MRLLNIVKKRLMKKKLYKITTGERTRFGMGSRVFEIVEGGVMEEESGQVISVVFLDPSGSEVAPAEFVEKTELRQFREGQRRVLHAVFVETREGECVVVSFKLPHWKTTWSDVRMLEDRM